MAEHPNAVLHRRGHDNFAKGEMASLAELIAENAVWHIGGKGAMSGDFQGREAVFAFFARLAELSAGTLKLEDHDFLATDEHSAALGRITATRSSKTLDAKFCEVVHWRDGQIVEQWFFVDDQYAVDEFWS